jgi:hypothetical protein
LLAGAAHSGLLAGLAGILALLLLFVLAGLLATLILLAGVALRIVAVAFGLVGIIRHTHISATPAAPCDRRAISGRAPYRILLNAAPVFLKLATNRTCWR